MYYSDKSQFDRKVQKILKSALRYKVIQNADDVNVILCANVMSDTNNCALCTDTAVILGRRKMGVLYFADVYQLSTITSVAYRKSELSIVIGGGETVKIDIAAEPAHYGEFVSYVMARAGNKTAPTTVGSVADELKKFKELLDIGAITEQEYDIKKKELLNI